MNSDSADTTTRSRSFSDAAAEKAHETIQDTQQKLNDAEARLRAGAEKAGEKLEHYSEDAKAAATDKIHDVETFIREKPLQAAGLAFAAGLLTALILRK